MTKRLWALLLALSLFLSVLPVPARAAEPESCYIQVYYGRCQEEDGSWSRKTLMNVYKDGKDLLFSARDLALLSGFEMVYDDYDNTIIYTRNSKEIIVHLNDSTVSCQYLPDTLSLPSKVRYINGEYFLSGAGMLPWLSVRYGIQDGMLMVIPIPVSYWDLDQVSLGDYDFRLSTCAQILGMSEKDVSALIYTEKSNASVILDFFAGGDTSLTDTQEFYDLFYDFFMDRSATSRAVGHMNAQSIAAAEMAKDIGSMVNFFVNHKAVEVATESMETVLDAAENVVKIMEYTSLYQEDNSLKISMLQSLIDNRGAKYDPEMIEGARQAVGAFTDYFTGVVYFLGYALLSGISDKIKDLAQPDIMEMLDIAGYSVDPDQFQMKRMDSYLLLSDAGQYIYNNTAVNVGTRDELMDTEAHAMLHLYAVEQAYRTFAQYVIDNRGTWDQLQTFLQLAGRAEGMYGKFLVAAAYVEEDICTFTHVQKRVNTLQKEFGKITCQRAAVSDITRTVDQGIYLAALMDMGIRNMKWQVADLDGDGVQELLVQGLAAAEHRKYPHTNPSYIVLDGLMVESITPNGAAGGSYIIQSKDGGQYYVRYDYATVTNQEQTAYTWNGRQWFTAAQWRHFPENDIQGNPIVVDQYFIQEKQVSQEVYDQEFLQTIDLNSDAQFDSADLLDQTISGDPAALMKELDNHFGSDIKILDYDSDQDGDKDRLYIISGAADRFTDQISDRYATGTEVHLSYTDKKTTLVLAQDTGSGIRLRICRVDTPYDAEVAFNARGISIGDTGYIYCPEGAPYVKAENPGTLMELMMKSADFISAAADKSGFSDNGSVLETRIGGNYARFNFSGGISVTGYMTNDDSSFFTDTLPLDLLAGQFRAGLYPRTEWTAETKVGSDPETIYSHFRTECYYFDPDVYQVFRVELTQRGRGYSGSIISVSAELVTDVSDDLRRQLGIPSGWVPHIFSSAMDLTTLLNCQYSELETKMDTFFPEPSYPAFVTAELDGVRYDLLFPDHGTISEFPPDIVHIYPTLGTFTFSDGITTDMDMEEIWGKIQPSYKWEDPFPQYGPSNEYLYHDAAFYYLDPTNSMIYRIHLYYDGNFGSSRVDYSAEELRQMVEDYFNRNIASNGETYVIFEDEVFDGMNTCTLFVRGQYPNADAANVLVADVIVDKDTGMMTIDYYYESTQVQLYTPTYTSALAGKKITQISVELVEYPPSEVTDYFYP